MRKYTERQFIEAVKSSTSYRQVLNQLGLKEAGGNYATVKRLIQKLKLDVSHMTGQTWNKGTNYQPRLSLEAYLSNARPIQTYKLKHRLLHEGIFEPKCYRCGLKSWLGQPIPLELEHKNGNSQDHTLSNLTLLCPNCHALTSTYRGKNKKSK